MRKSKSLISLHREGDPEIEGNPAAQTPVSLDWYGHINTLRGGWEV
jgi:hypothetical protein